MISRLIKSITTATCGAVFLFFLLRLAAAMVLNALGDRAIPVFGKAVFLKAVPNYNFVFSLPMPEAWIILISSVIIIFTAFLYLIFVSRHGRQLFLAYTLIIGGAFSNLYERIVSGYVLDYVNIGLFGVWGAWNLADFCILAGIAFWLFSKEKRNG